MRARWIVLVLLAFPLVFLASASFGQLVPLRPPAPLCAVDPSIPGDSFCFDPQVAVRGPLGFAVASSSELRSAELNDIRYGCGADLLGLLGGPVGEVGLARGSLSFDVAPESPSIAFDGRGRMIGAWHTVLFGRADVSYRRFDEQGYPLGEARPLGDPREGFCQWNPRLAANAEGRFAIAWEESEGCDVDRTTVAMQIFDGAGRPVVPVVSIPAPTAQGSASRPMIGVDRGGNVLFLWNEQTVSDGRRGVVYARRFDRDGNPLAARYRVGLADALALLPNGRYVVGWIDRRLPVRESSVRLQRFTAEGVPFVVRGGGQVDASGGADSLEALAVDRHGNLAVVWRAGDRVRLALLDTDLAPQGSTVELGSIQSQQIFEVRHAGVALADDGRLVAAWTAPRSSPRPGSRLVPVVAQTFRALHDADACSVVGRAFVCDWVGGTGASPPLRIVFGSGRSGETPLLGDWDGDGRADPCVYRQGLFSCDLEHNGGGGEGKSRVRGEPGDRPLFADVDGDRRADPCVRRGDRLLCDLDRDGTLEPQGSFGRASDDVLLGDVDGDGRAELCLYRDGLVICDVGRGEGAPELRLNLRPAIEAFGPSTPALGDVDGDGRAEPCAFSDFEVVCGIFPRTGGLPIRTVRRFVPGRPGPARAYLLGDVDAF